AAGVTGVFTGRDIGLKLYGRRVRDAPVLAVDEVRFVGERVAAVVAESRSAAEKAAATVVIGVEELPPALEAGGALSPRRPPGHQTPRPSPPGAVPPGPAPHT